MDTRGLPYLNRSRNMLSALSAGRTPWHQVVGWINGAIPIFTAYFPEFLDDFRNITKEPRPIDFPLALSQDLAENERRSREKQKQIEEANFENVRRLCLQVMLFIDGIVLVANDQLHQEEQAAQKAAQKARDEKKAAKTNVAPDTTDSTMAHKIFISHAHKDKAFVDKLVDFLQITHGVTHDDIFCTSVQGMGIPNGENFVDYIRARLKGCKIVVFVLSQSYFMSEFCLAELGATWALANAPRTFLLIPPAGLERMKGLLGNIQADPINTSEGIVDFCDAIQKQLGIAITNMPRWEAKKAELLEAVADLISKQPPSDHVTRTEFESLQAKHVHALADIVKNMDTIEKLEATVEALKQLGRNDDNLPEVINH